MSRVVFIHKNLCQLSNMSALSTAQSTCFRSIHVLKNFSGFNSCCSWNREIYLPRSVSNKFSLVNVMFSRTLSTQRTLHDDSKPKYGKSPDFSEMMPERSPEEPSKFTKMMKNLLLERLGLGTSKAIVSGKGFTIYQLLSMHIVYQDFFKAYSMPDTFNSWFLVMELHVWMFSVRLMAEGPLGKKLRNALVEAMWNDVENRMKKIASSKQAQETMNTLSGQFNAAFIGYDEGMLSDDKVLASALWRRFFNRECDDPRKVESLVSFVRKQLYLLDELTRDDIIEHQRFNLLSITHDQ